MQPLIGTVTEECNCYEPHETTPPVSRGTTIVCNSPPRFIYPAKPPESPFVKIMCLRPISYVPRYANENAIAKGGFLRCGRYKAIENVTDVTVHGWMLLDRVKWLWRKPATSVFSLWSHETVRITGKKSSTWPSPTDSIHKPWKFSSLADIFALEMSQRYALIEEIYDK